MEINKTQLQEALEIVKPGLANKEVIDQSTSFAFIDGRVVTYNDEISLSHPIPGLELTGAILADNLYKFLAKVKKDDVTFEVSGNEIILTTGRAKAGLTLQDEIKLPLDEEIAEKGKWKTIPENLIQAIDFVMGACSRDMSRPVLTCVHVNKEGFIEASDGYRISYYTIENELPVETFLLPAISATVLVKLKPIKIAEGRGWIHFQTEEKTILSCRVFEDDYPKTAKFLSMKGATLTLPKLLNGALERAMVFSKREHMLDESVEVEIADRELTLRATSPSGWFEESLNIRYDDAPIAFHITPYLLKNILQETQRCEISDDKLKFSGEGWVYVTALRGTISKKKKK